MSSKLKQKKASDSPKKKQNNSDSIAGSMLRNVVSELGLDDLFGGEIVHASFDCPSNLRKAFKEVTNQEGSSVCKELQKYMAARVIVSRLKKHALGNTLSKLVESSFVIENLNLNTYVQSRVRRYHKEITAEKHESLTKEQLEEQEKVAEKRKLFSMVAEQWDLHRKREWREKWKREAEKWKDKVPETKVILDLADEEAKLS